MRIENTVLRVKRFLVRTATTLAFLLAPALGAGDLSADVGTSSVPAVTGSTYSSGFDQQEPSEGDGQLKVTVIRSLVSETIKLLVTFPKDADPISIRVHNLLGRQILQLSETSAIRGEATYQIDTSDLPNGHYFVVIEALGQRITRKVVLSR